MLCSCPKRGWSWRISASRRSPSVGRTAPRSASCSKRSRAAIWSSRGELASGVVTSTAAGAPRPIVTIRYVGNALTVAAWAP